MWMYLGDQRGSLKRSKPLVMKLYRSSNPRWTTLLLHRYTHTHTHVCKFKHYTAHTVIWTCTVLKKKIFFFFVYPAQTSCSRLTVCICNERGGTKTHQDHQDESACSPSPASTSRYQQQTKSGIDCEAFDSLCVCSVFCVDCRGCWKKKKHHRGLAAE